VLPVDPIPELARIPHMKTTHHNYSEDTNFCAAVIGKTLTTYNYFHTLEEAKFHAESSQELLAMLGIKVTVAVMSREPEQKIEGFYKHELN